MEEDQVKQQARLLAYQWACQDIPTQRLTYGDYVRTSAVLVEVTGSVERSSTILTAVIDQAKRAGYSSEWVQMELGFEAQVEATGDRQACLLAALHLHPVDDTALDLYNQRQIRFSSYSSTL